jgi:bifunctional pyridoxal-dependent enzyme with beta-cystathionase and maltose regulon repressor activities
MRERLIRAWRRARRELKAKGLPSFAGERRLFETVFKECKLNISPGQAFHCSEPGWFRLRFAAPDARLDEGLRRLSVYLRPRGQRHSG